MGRFRHVHWIVGAVFTVVVLRAGMLHLFPAQKSSLTQIADSQYQRTIELSPYRGSILDRRGEPLAISIRKPSVAVNPRLFNAESPQAHNVAQILKIPFAKIKKLNAKKTYFSWLSRRIDHRKAEDIAALEIPGINIIAEPSRFYPTGESAAHLIGFIGSDNSGLGGLERQFDQDLKGQAFKVVATKDARGQFILKETLGAAPEKSGNNIHLSIDRVIQEIAESELEKGIKAANAKRGFVIVSDPHTGKILALANYPSFDPNYPKQINIRDTKNSALLDLFEPGSVTKQFVIAAALEDRKTSVNEVHDCEKGVLRIGRDRIHDDHPADKITTEETIIRSSNICTYKIAMKMGKEKTRAALTDFGFTSRDNDLNFPGQSFGRISSHENWKNIRFANIAFGQGLMVTGLELVQAMGAIANGGKLMKPMLIDRIASSDGMIVTNGTPTMLRQVIAPKTAQTMRSILAKVVTDQHGTGKAAATPSFTTAGKTGTAQKVDPGTRGYSADKRIASFLGFSPVNDPYIVMYVQVDEPRNKPYYGGKWAAPIFSAITERTLRYLNVAPDKIPEKVIDTARADNNEPNSAKM